MDITINKRAGRVEHYNPFCREPMHIPLAAKVKVARTYMYTHHFTDAKDTLLLHPITLPEILLLKAIQALFYYQH